jgi:hypothetical protein
MANVELLMIARKSRHYQSPKSFPLLDQRRFDGQQRPAIPLGMMKIKNNIGKFARVLYPYSETALHNQCPCKRALSKGGLHCRRKGFGIERHNVTSNQRRSELNPFADMVHSFDSLQTSHQIAFVSTCPTKTESPIFTGLFHGFRNFCRTEFRSETTRI